MFEAQQSSDHVLDLVFGGRAVAGNRLFDFRRRILADFARGLLRGQQNHAARMSEYDGGAHVTRVKHIFDGDRVRLVSRDQLGNPIVDIVQT